MDDNASPPLPPGRTPSSAVRVVTQAELVEFVRLMPALRRPRVRQGGLPLHRADVARLLRRARDLDRWQRLRDELFRRLRAGAAVAPGPLSARVQRVEVEDHLPLRRLLAEGWVTEAEARLLERDNLPPCALYLHVECADGRRFCTPVERPEDPENNTG